ncbi:hypothetical protein BV22DRAFT_1052853, partial [Leucogyrophana mollusca]
FGESAKLKVAVAPEKMSGPQAHLNKSLLATAMQHIGTKDSKRVVFCVKIKRDGIIFQTSQRSPKDANAIIRDANETEVPAEIQSIFMDKDLQHQKREPRVFVIVKRFVALGPTEKKWDPYRRFGWVVAGALFFDILHPAEVIEVENLVTLFAKTSYYHRQIRAKIIHALPIKRVGHPQDRLQIALLTSHKSVYLSESSNEESTLREDEFVGPMDILN